MFGHARRRWRSKVGILLACRTAAYAVFISCEARPTGLARREVFMKRPFTITAVVMFLVCAGCGDSHEKLAGESVSTMKEMVSVLDSIKDEASAKAAKPKLLK